MAKKGEMYYGAKEMRLTVPIDTGRNGEHLGLGAGSHIIELKPKGVYRITNCNVIITLTKKQRQTLVETGHMDWSIFEDPTR